MPKKREENPKWVSSEQFLRGMPHGTVFVSQLLREEEAAAPQPESDAPRRLRGASCNTRVA